MDLDEKIEKEREKNDLLALEIERLKRRPYEVAESSDLRGLSPRELLQQEMTTLSRRIRIELSLTGELEELKRQKKESDQRLEALKGKKQEAAQGARSGFDHSPDYRVVRIRGREHRLTSKQAQLIQLLHEAYLDGNPSLGTDYLLEKIGDSSSRLVDIFRSRPDARKDLIKSTGRGIVRLNL